MPFPPIKKTMEGLLEDLIFRLTLVERRLATASTNTTTPVPESACIPGEIRLYSAATAPKGWLLCDGSAIDRATYAELFALVGTNYGAGNGTTTFNLPNLKGRVPVGQDPADATFDVLGETGGEKAHTLTIPEMPAHQHNQTANSAAIAPAGGSAIAGLSFGGTPTNAGSQQYTNFIGGGGAHNNLQPFLVLTYIICVGETATATTGTYPGITYPSGPTAWPGRTS